jgi:polyisoprenoid-binding protein YceI
MSLTQAITLNEDGSLLPQFQNWADRSYKKKKTIFHAIEEYTGSTGKFDFGINHEFIYPINARTIATDQNMRNRAISNQILLTNQYEFISFVPTQIEGLPDTVAVGQSYNFQIVGELTIIGETREVTFVTEATLVSDNELTGLATTTFNHDDFGITIPFSQSVQAVAEEVTLELQFTAKAG